jgi:phosphopantetheine adenylyltransferase
MNSLVKSLILPFLTEVDSLGEGKTVGLFGGGFQPPTKGHLKVVKIEKINHLILQIMLSLFGLSSKGSLIT